MRLCCLPQCQCPQSPRAPYPIDEIWEFVGAKAKNVSPEKKAEGWGDVWTWTAIDADTKLIASYTLGDRGASTARDFIRVHKTLRVTTAMEAGLTDHVWEIDELIGLSDGRA